MEHVLNRFETTICNPQFVADCFYDKQTRERLLQSGHLWPHKDSLQCTLNVPVPYTQRRGATPLHWAIIGAQHAAEGKVSDWANEVQMNFHVGLCCLSNVRLTKNLKEECSLCLMKHREPQKLDHVMFPSYQETEEYSRYLQTCRNDFLIHRPGTLLKNQSSSSLEFSGSSLCLCMSSVTLLSLQSALVPLLSHFLEERLNSST